MEQHRQDKASCVLELLVGRLPGLQKCMRLVLWIWEPRNLFGYQSLQFPPLELSSSSVFQRSSTLHMLHAPSHILVPKNFHEGL